MAARFLNYPLPVDPQTKQQLPWWTILGVTLDDLIYVAASIHELDTLKTDFAHLEQVTKATKLAQQQIEVI